jgi:hypothetical protein
MVLYFDIENYLEVQNFEIGKGVEIQNSECENYLEILNFDIGN